MALEGTIKDFGLADILQLIYFQKKTGVLMLTGRIDRVRIMFHEGNIVWAESKKRTEGNRIGRILLKKGLIKEDDLRAALEEQKETGGRIGDIFLKQGLVEKEDIWKTLTSQLTETIIQLFSWKEGTYEFQQQPVPISKDMPITLDTQHLLMEGMRILDEWTLIEGRITLDTVFKRTGKKDHTLTPEEKDILEFVDGENDVSIIIDLSRMDDFQASKTLLSIMEKGIIEAAKALPVAEEAITPARMLKQRSLGVFFPLIIFLSAFILSLTATTLIKTESQKSLTALLSGDPRKRFETINNIDELRFMAEVARYKNGSYPSHLNELGNNKDSWGRPYSYKTENDILLIISAGPDGKVGTNDDLY